MVYEVRGAAVVETEDKASYEGGRVEVYVGRFQTERQSWDSGNRSMYLLCVKKYKLQSIEDRTVDKEMDIIAII